MNDLKKILLMSRIMSFVNEVCLKFRMVKVTFKKSALYHIIRYVVYVYQVCIAIDF